MRDNSALLTRLEAAKRELAKETAVMEGFKVTANGSFGKFGSKYSILYSPDLLIQTTLTGQLALLQLIEQLELHGIGVVSANTDGIVIKCPRGKERERDALLRVWEFFSCFETEQADYVALCSKDVNNYVAIKRDGKVKRKGLYAPTGLMKNPTAVICVDAVVQALVTEGEFSVEEYIQDCEDVTKFLTVRSVKGGAVSATGQYLGKSVRWYYGRNAQGCISYKTNGNKVARSEGAVPLMELPGQLPSDIDYDWYIAEATSILKDIGART